MTYQSGTKVRTKVGIVSNPRRTNEIRYAKNTLCTVIGVLNEEADVYRVSLPDGNTAVVPMSALYLVEIKNEGEVLLFVGKCSGFQFHGRVICESDRFMIVDQLGGVNKEVSVEKSLYKIFKEVK